MSSPDQDPRSVSSLIAELRQVTESRRNLARSFLLCYMSDRWERSPNESMREWCDEANLHLASTERFKMIVRLAEGQWKDGRFVEMSKEEIDKWLGK